MCLGGGSASAPATQTVVQQQAIPQYQQQFSQDLDNASRDIASRPFPTYQGQRIADFSPLQQQGLNQANYAGTQVAGQAQTDYGLAADTTAKYLASQYGQGVGASLIGGPSAAQQVGQLGALPLAGPAQQVGQLNGLPTMGLNADPSKFGQQATAQMVNQALTPGAVAPWMSPYVQQSLAPQLLQAQLTADQQGKQLNAQASQAGAFGDARAGVAQAMQNYFTQQTMAGIEGQGFNNAYNSAVGAAQNAYGQNNAAIQQNNQAGQNAFALNAGQFNTDTAAQLSNYKANQATTAQNANTLLGQYNANLAGTQANNAANLAQVNQNDQALLGGYNANLAGAQANNAANLGVFNANLATNQSNNQAALAAFQANAGQFNTDRAAQLASAQQLAGIGTNQYANASQTAQDMFNMGAPQQQQQQQGLSTAYQDFLNQFEYPQEMLNLQLATLQGAPYNTTRLTTTPYSSSAQSIGALASLFGVAGQLGGSGGSGATRSGIFGAGA